MKRNTPVFITLLVVGLICTVAFFPFVVIMQLYGPDIGSDKIYADTQNYIEFDATVEEINLYPETNTITIELNHDIEKFYNPFVINGENYDIAVSNGVMEVLTESTQIHIAAHGVSYYSLHEIACISYDGTEYLPFEVGYKNIAAHHKQASDKSIKIISILGSVILFGIILLTVDLIVYIKAKPEKKVTDNASESKPESETAA